MAQHKEGEGELPLTQTAGSTAAPAMGLAGRLQHRQTLRRQSTQTRQWMVIRRDGSSTLVSSHKLETTHALGLHLRDFRY